jgi:uncharacterized protein YgbK (DUF1537 family)
LEEAPESGALKTSLENWMEAGFDAVVCDAQTESDLARIAAASRMLRERPLWVGSAGLMRALAGTERHMTRPVQAVASKPVLIVVGSASGASHTQFGVLAQDPGVTSLTIPPSALRHGAEANEMRAIARRLDDALASGLDVAVTIDDEKIDLQEGPRLSSALADMIAPRLERAGGLVVTGGEMARAILTRAGISSLAIRGEIEPGVPVGQSVGEIAIPVITKAGAFGDRLTLIRCRAALRGDTSDHPAPSKAG